jgi:cell wall-associated NlpC family hydrolase
MLLQIAIIVLLAIGWLIYLILLFDIIRNSSSWAALRAAAGKDSPGGVHWGRWALWGAILTLSLSLSPNQASGVFSQRPRSPGDITLRRNPAAPPEVCPAQGAYETFSAIPATVSLQELPILKRRYLLDPFTHPHRVIPQPLPPESSNNSGPLLTRPPSPLASIDLSDRLLAKARHYLHTPYRRGGSLQHGKATDCSGFVQYVYKSCDVTLPRSSSQQSQEGKLVASTMDFAKMAPGDLLFFSLGRRRVGHVGIYLGEGKMIHAADRRHGVIVSDLRQAYYRGKFVAAKRILTDEDDH